MHRRLATGNNGNRALCFCHKRNNLIYFNFRMGIYVPRFFYVAPNTADFATTKTNKISCRALVVALTLNGEEVFHDGKCAHRAMCNVQSAMSVPNVARCSLHVYGCRNSVALSVFNRREAIVIGPTPPGTGVMKDAFAATGVKSTSPLIA